MHHIDRPLHRHGLLFACLLLLELAACGGPGSDLPLLPVAGPVDYGLGLGDQVRIITFGEETLTGEFRVNDSGNIALPLVGAVSSCWPAWYASRSSVTLR